jgi:hypothetical protein
VHIYVAFTAVLYVLSCVRLLPYVSLPHFQELCVMSGFRREVDEKFTLLGYYYYFLLFSTSEDGTDWLSRNVGKKLQLLAA